MKDLLGNGWSDLWPVTVISYVIFYKPSITDAIATRTYWDTPPVLHRCNILSTLDLDCTLIPPMVSHWLSVKQPGGG